MYLCCLNMYSRTSCKNIHFTYPEQRAVYFLANIPNPSLIRKDLFPLSTQVDIAVTQMFPAFLFLCDHHTRTGIVPSLVPRPLPSAGEEPGYEVDTLILVSLIPRPSYIQFLYPQSQALSSKCRVWSLGTRLRVSTLERLRTFTPTVSFLTLIISVGPKSKNLQ